MAHLTEAEKAIHRLIAEDSFEDTCSIHTWSGYIDSFGDEQSSFTTVSGIACGIKYGKALESERGEIVVLEDEGILRLSLDTTLTEKDEITTRGIRWKIDGINTGVTVLNVNLKRLDV